MTLRCDICGRFHKGGPGTAWKMIYSGSPPIPDHEVNACATCVGKHGPFEPQHGIKPEMSCGIFKEPA